MRQYELFALDKYSQVIDNKLLNFLAKSKTESHQCAMDYVTNRANKLHRDDTATYVLRFHERVIFEKKVKRNDSF